MQDKRTLITFEISPELKQRLVSESKEKDLSVSWLIRNILKEHFKYIDEKTS